MAAETAVVKQLAKESETLRVALVRNDQSASAQTQQVAACNALHELEERLSRWLLQARDLLRSDTLPLTQEFLAQMLGVQRSSVTLVARRLQAGPKPLPRIRLRNRADRAALFWWTLDFSPQPSPGSRDPALRSPLRGGVPLNQVGIVAFLQASSRCEEPSQAVQIDLPLRKRRHSSSCSNDSGITLSASRPSKSICPFEHLFRAERASKAAKMEELMVQSATMTGKPLCPSGSHNAPEAEKSVSMPLR